MCENVLVVNVDPGIDDAYALLVLIAAHKLNLICLSAILCSVGNVERGQSCENLAVVTSLLNADNTILPHITYFEGASNSMIKKDEFSDYYGKDGLGDVAERPEVNTDDFKKYYEFQQFMYKLVEEFPQKVSFMSLGPLTVPATLFLQQSEINLKDIWIMGGNDIEHTDFPEWNFYFDPHAANVTLNHSNVPVYITTFQACERVEVPMSWRNNTLGVIDMPFIKFMNEAESNYYGEHRPDVWNMYDATVAAAFVNNDIITNKRERGVEIYLGEEKAQGLIIEGSKKITFIESIDTEMYQRTIKDAAEAFL